MVLQVGSTRLAAVVGDIDPLVWVAIDADLVLLTAAMRMGGEGHPVRGGLHRPKTEGLGQIRRRMHLGSRAGVEHAGIGCLEFQGRHGVGVGREVGIEGV